MGNIRKIPGKIAVCGSGKKPGDKSGEMTTNLASVDLKLLRTLSCVHHKSVPRPIASAMERQSNSLLWVAFLHVQSAGKVCPGDITSMNPPPVRPLTGLICTLWTFVTNLKPTWPLGPR